MRRFEPQYRLLGPEDFQVKVTRKPGRPLKPEKRNCVLCLSDEDVNAWDERHDQFMCGHCELRVWRSIGVRKPPANDPIWPTEFGKHYHRALAVWSAINSELIRLRYQKRTGKMGAHPACYRMTREAREAYEDQPAPPRAYMP
jgi:hypothetical protein